MASKTPYGPRGAARHSNRTHRVFYWAFLDQAGHQRLWLVVDSSGSGDAHYLGFDFLARMANKTPCGRGFQLRCLQEQECR